MSRQAHRLIRCRKQQRPRGKLSSGGVERAEAVLPRLVNVNCMIPESEAKEIADAIKTVGGRRFQVAGHTDSKGKDDYNMKLSQERAEAVRNYLISKGIAAERLTAKGYGETKPVADNATEEGRTQNRRVELQRLN